VIHILDTELKKDKTVYLSLTKILGINFSISRKICKRLGFSSYMLVKDLNKDQINSILSTISKLKLKTSNNLKKKLSLDKKILIDIKSYRGNRLINKLPVRGQRTHTNSKTCKS
jgi:small subunit ribosomal protein S13